MRVFQTATLEKFMTNTQTTQNHPKPEAASYIILRLPQVMARVGLRRASIYQHMNNGTFPRSVKLTSHAIGWRENEIEAWLASRCRTKTDAILKA